MTPDRVLSSIAEALQVEPGQVTRETKAQDLAAWDSLGTMQILLALETDFGLRLAPGETGKLQSVEGILSLLREAGKLS